MTGHINIVIIVIKQLKVQPLEIILAELMIPTSVADP
jgi:hypothetical protein